MRSLKMIFGAAFVAGSIAATILTFLQSHGAGISVGLLLALVTFGFIYDNRQLGTGVSTADEDIGAGTMAAQRKVAMRHARVLSQREDGDIHVGRPH